MNFVYIDIDSLRPDHIGAYGYERDPPTTPNINELAEDAVRFERAYTANSPCMPSRASLLSGRYGINNGVTTHGSSAQVMNGPQWRDDEYGFSRGCWTLPELLFQNEVRGGGGMRTCAVSSFPRHPAPWFYHLWHEFYQPQEPDAAQLEYFQTPRAEMVADIATDFLDENADGDFFLYAQFWDPHAPCKRSDDEIDEFEDTPLPPYPTEEMIDEHTEWDAWHSADRMGIGDREDLRDTLASYDAEVRYADRHIGRLLDALRQHGVYDDTTVVVTADHGEEFGEHGVYRDHWSTHEGTQRVPLIVKPPAGIGAETGSREGLVTNVDLPPTIADLAGLEPPSAWQGDSLLPVLSNDAEPRDGIVVDHGLFTAQRAVVTEGWKFVRTYHPGMWDGVVPERQLFDIQHDPWEQEDVSGEYPDVAEDLEERMAVWAERHAGEYEDSLRRTARLVPQATRNNLEYFEGV